MRLKRIQLGIAVFFFSLHVMADNSAIQLIYNNTSLTIELSERPRFVKENSEITLTTDIRSITIALPCKVTFVEQTSGLEDIIIIRNNEEKSPINVFSVDGRKIATIKKEDRYFLKRGIYVINGKKFLVK